MSVHIYSLTVKMRFSLVTLKSDTFFFILPFLRSHSQYLIEKMVIYKG